MRYQYALLVVIAVGLAGCGGGGGDGGYSVGIADVSGVVFDQNGNVVRNAQVFYSDSYSGVFRQTLSNSNGAYVLKAVPALDDLIQCQLQSNGVQYFGQNLARLYDGTRTMTVNIALYPQTQLASIKGTVADSHGNLLVNAKIFAIPAAGPTLSSSYGITDNTGNFFIGGLVSGTKYSIQVNGLGYNSAIDTETLNAGQVLTVNYSLPPASNTTLGPPTNVNAIAYTSPGEATTNLRMQRAISAIKNLSTPGRLVKHMAIGKRTTSYGGTVEIDVSWTPISNTSLLGYGIYQAVGNQKLVNVDLLRDPLASVYEDMYGGLVSGQTYTYAVTTVSTGATNTSGESGYSNLTAVTPLGPLSIGNVVTSTQPTFSWSQASGAANYALMLFSQYPDIGVTDIFDNLNNPVTGTSYTYSGTSLKSGQTYYYVLVGFSSAGSQSISPVGQFTVP
ncbi:MAG: carboxypeptidase regulatory-like domain-containing protein [Fimbriimonas sp.]|nr:carboxypeptidase regulatory-like domain-containing protein [Fimbriimonas sp.]